MNKMEACIFFWCSHQVGDCTFVACIFFWCKKAGLGPLHTQCYTWCTSCRRELSVLIYQKPRCPFFRTNDEINACFPISLAYAFCISHKLERTALNDMIIIEHTLWGVDTRTIRSKNGLENIYDPSSLGDCFECSLFCDGLRDREGLNQNSRVPHPIRCLHPIRLG
jgi:hypothetical protein